MIPRIFVSSTYYDLKYVRASLEKFIYNYGFEPVLFESDKVIYQQNKPIDYSAYNEVNLCHMMILIIGGSFGTLATKEKSLEEIQKHELEMVSITRREFETAIKMKIPIFIFIEKNVNAEYKTYQENQDFLDNQIILNKGYKSKNKKFKFAHVDNINVFKFIDIVQKKYIKTFEKVDEIECFLKSQLSGMFYQYLDLLRNQEENKEILDTVKELQNVTLKMNEMLNSVGKEIIGKNIKEYKRVKDVQAKIMINYFGEQLMYEINFENQFSKNELKDETFKKLAQIIYTNVFEADIPEIIEHSGKICYESINIKGQMIVFNKIQELFFKINENIKIKSFAIGKINGLYKEKVYPYLKAENAKNLLLERIKEILEFKLIDPAI